MVTIVRSLKKGEKVSMQGFMAISKVKRKARNGTHPQNGKTIKIPASNSVRFKAGKALKDAIK